MPAKFDYARNLKFFIWSLMHSRHMLGRNGNEKTKFGTVWVIRLLRLSSLTRIPAVWKVNVFLLPIDNCPWIAQKLKEEYLSKSALCPRSKLPKLAASPFFHFFIQWFWFLLIEHCNTLEIIMCIMNFLLYFVFSFLIQLMKPVYRVISPSTQHHSFFRNLPPEIFDWFPALLLYLRSDKMLFQIQLRYFDFSLQRPKV